MTEYPQRASHFLRVVPRGRSCFVLWVEFGTCPSSRIGRLRQGWTQMSMPLLNVSFVGQGCSG